MPRTIIIGAGPAGLAAAHLLSEAGEEVCILEKDPLYVGGLAKTIDYKGYRVDIGPHRFFSKSAEVNKFWNDILGTEFLLCNRKTRIFFKGQFFDYPLSLKETLLKLGPLFSFSCLLSFLNARLQKPKAIETFDQWVSYNFGNKLYSTFFKEYTEKVWGLPCKEISSDWAAQRIKNFSFFSLIRNFINRLFKIKKNTQLTKSLIDKFHYPRLGAGQMWETTARAIEEKGNVVQLGQQVSKINWNSHGANSLETTKGSGKTDLHHFDNLISSMPLTRLLEILDPSAPSSVLAAAAKLRYRDYLNVGLIIDKPNIFDDQWIYINESSVKVARIQNYANWSVDLIPDSKTTCLGLEYFCFLGDELWSLADKELADLAWQELDYLKLAKGSKLIDSFVIRVPKAYPIYDDNYKVAVKQIRNFLADSLPNLQLSGRNAMHRYNNQDHSMCCGFLAAKNILQQDRALDPWKVNIDAEYHEELRKTVNER